MSKSRKMSMLKYFTTSAKRKDESTVKKGELDRKAEYKDYEAKRRKHGFRESWKTGRPWLSDSIDHGMTRKMCVEFYVNGGGMLPSSKGNVTFIKSATNYKLEAVKDHEMSLLHKKAEAAIKANTLPHGKTWAEKN